MNTVPKRICDELRVVLNNAVENNHRSFIIIAGQYGIYQVPIIHTILAQLRGEPLNKILWCYDKELSLSSNQKKMTKQIKEAKEKGQIIDETANQISVFLNSHKIRYCRYKDTSSILGQTYDMLVLQNFDHMKPNDFARTIETVSGKGTILLLLESINNIEELYAQVTRKDSPERNSNNLTKRFVATIKKCGNCVCIDSEFNALLGVIKSPVLAKSTSDNNALAEMIKDLSTTPIIGPLIQQAKTKDQARVILHLYDILQSGELGKIVGITASRGRGKSAAVGLALAAAIAHNFSNVFVTSPSPENLNTLWEFVLKGFDVLGLQEHKDYDIVVSSKYKNVIVRINVHQTFKGNKTRQTISYIEPSDSKALSNCELLAIDEAAAIPLPIVRNLIGPYDIFLSSTVNGYEGTGRALSLKLFDEFEHKMPDDKFTKVEMESPIRYSENDPIEAWLYSYLCLDAQPSAPTVMPDPEQCELYMIDRNLLFSGNDTTEQYLRSIVSLSVASHYKNEPNDLCLMADSPHHRIFCLVAPLQRDNKLNVICYIQVALEGNIAKETVSNSFNRGTSPSGDLIAWKVSQHMNSPEFAQLTGIRIVRIAVHPQMQGQGYGKRAIEQLLAFYSNPNVITESSAEPTKKSDRILFKLLNQTPHEHVHYASVSFGLTEKLFKFWTVNGFSPVYIAKKKTEVTGEHSMFVLWDLHPNEDQENEEVSWLDSFCLEFRKRFGHLLSYSFQSFSPKLVDMIYKSVEPRSRCDVDPSAFLDEKDVNRLQTFTKSNTGYGDVEDLMPNLAELYFQRLVKVKLSRLQQSVLASIGFQHCSLEECAQNHGIEPNQVISNVQKICSVMVDYCKGKITPSVDKIKSAKAE